MRRVLLEANGSLTSGYMVKNIISLGHDVVGSDIHDDTISKCMGFQTIILPKFNHPKIKLILKKEIIKNKITDVIPTLDESLFYWSSMKKTFKTLGCKIHISNPSTIKIFQDKWLTYKFFEKNGLPTPLTSLKNEFPLTKPRFGRGSIGVEFFNYKRDMKNLISQEICKGNEYTIDVLIHKGNPVYIVPRSRDKIIDGKSVRSTIVNSKLIKKYTKLICSKIKFEGVINIQCFINGKKIKFIEINPRFGGGTSLSLKGSENWLDLILNGIPRDWKPKKVKWGLAMSRYYEEFYF